MPLGSEAEFGKRIIFASYYVSELTGNRPTESFAGMIREPSVLRAIAAAGSVTKLGLLCGVAPQSIYGWRKIPDRHVNVIARKLRIPRHELRPDLWPRKPTKGAQNAES